MSMKGTINKAKKMVAEIEKRRNINANKFFIVEEWNTEPKGALIIVKNHQNPKLDR